MGKDVLSLTYWVHENLYATTVTFSKEMAVRWFRLFLGNREDFYRLAIYGFVLRAQRELDNEAFPEAEFQDFCREFLGKVSLAHRGVGHLYPAPMFARSRNVCDLVTEQRSQGPSLVRLISKKQVENQVSAIGGGGM